MKNGKCCVGGITSGGRYVRLLNSVGENQPEDTHLKIKQVYSIDFNFREDTEPPHVEDILIQTCKYEGILKKELTVFDFIHKRDVHIWEGNPCMLFDNKIKWTANGSGYVSKEDIPNHSVGFWISDRDLIKSNYYDKVRYGYRSTDGTWKNITYVGFEEAINVIPAGTLIRVSLARWWDANGSTELRCSLQLSGWYDV